MQRSRHGLDDGDWWGAELEVPATAAVLDFVLSDGSQVDTCLKLTEQRFMAMPEYARGDVLADMF